MKTQVHNLQPCITYRTNFKLVLKIETDCSKASQTENKKKSENTVLNIKG